MSRSFDYSSGREGGLAGIDLSARRWYHFVQSTRMDQMDFVRQHQALCALREWFRWMIGFGFAAGSGCVLVLVGGAGGLPRVLLIAAIISFALSILITFLLGMATVRFDERAPVRDESGTMISIRDYRLPVGISLGALSWVALSLLMIATAFVIGWVLVRPFP